MKTVIFLVTWTVITIVPSHETRINNVNEYGIGGNSPAYNDLVYRYSTEEKQMSKEFLTEEAADEFIEKMPKEQSFIMFASYCANPKKEKIIKEELK